VVAHTYSDARAYTIDTQTDRQKERERERERDGRMDGHTDSIVDHITFSVIGGFNNMNKNFTLTWEFELNRINLIAIGDNRSVNM